jgi:transposase
MEEVMQILEAYDLCQSYRGAARLAGVSEHTVARYVAERDAGRALGAGVHRSRQIDPYLAKMEEWVERSHGKVRSDVCHEKLAALGYRGSERTTRRAVAQAKARYRTGQRRVYRPWLPEPGLWFQWDWAQGPQIQRRTCLLYCAWLAWSRHRVVLPTWDRTFPTLVSCLDRTFRLWAGVPTYGLTDNEKTVTVEHVAGIAVRNPDMVAVARHYGFTVATCWPADPETKGGSEATVRIAKADLLPTEMNLLPGYASFGEVEAACAAFCAEVNARAHRMTARPPVELLAEERHRLHRVPEVAHTVAFGETRRVGWDGTVSFGGVRYSAPSTLVEETVWCRVEGDELVLVAMSGTGPQEVARHRLSTPGTPRIDPAHYPPRPDGMPTRTPRARDPDEAAFLAIGPGAERWLIAAAASGASRVRAKMAEAVALAKLHGGEAVDRALLAAAGAERFGEGDLARILDYQRGGSPEPPTGVGSAPTEAWSLQPGTAAWQEIGR